MTRIVVTGAASGVGLATARMLVARGSGVVLIDRDAAGLAVAAAALGDGAQALTVDVADPPAVAAAFAAAGEFDGAVNCAGVLGPRGTTPALSLDDMRRVFDVNVFGLFACMQAELGHLLPKGRGAIVNVASGAGLVGTRAMPGYGASKHAVVGLTRCAAADHAAAGVRVNAVCPGVVRTPMATGLAPPDQQPLLARAHPMERIAEPEEIAAAILWLLSDAASFVTGVAMPVDGGYTAV